jgi:GT2 family glycosyltransferase
MSANPDAGPSVYIPTLEAGKRLAETLRALAKQTRPAAVVIADNTGSPEAVEALRPNLPALKTVRFGRNLGFGKAINRAVEAHPGDPVILLNDDAVPRPDFVENLMRPAEQHGAEMVAGVLLRGSDERVIDSAGVVADRTLLAFDHLNGEDVSALASAPDPLGPSGGAALYTAEAFARAGGFDEEIFAYYEDLDLALRLRAQGASCALARDAFAVHGYSETLGARSAGKYALTGWGRGYLLRRYGVMRSPRLAVRAAGIEALIGAGQLLRQRTTAGIAGRLRGWRHARGMPLRSVPEGALSDLSVREAVERRLRRYG